MYARRHFVTVEQPGRPPRQLHYRRAGSGPPVLLLHKSPESSHEFEAHLELWAKDFTAIALDTPGYGLSDPLPDAHLGLAPLADNIASAMDALGIDQAPIYGAHTGGMIALEFARRHPKRSPMIVMNGIVALTDDEKADILGNYFDDFMPKRDGRHMTRIWHRTRDQLVFFPWYNKTEAARARMRETFDVPSAAALHPNLLDLLRCGIHERDGYSAAFSGNGAKLIQDVGIRLVIMDDQKSILLNQLDRLPKPLPKLVSMETFPDQAALECRARELLKTGATARSPAVVATATMSTQAWKTYADAGQGQMFLKRDHGGHGRPVVLLHDLGRSARQWDPLVAMLLGRRPTIAVDLPGHGETGDLAGNKMTLAATSASIRAALGSLGVGAFDLVAAGGAAAIAASVASSCNVASMMLVEPWLLSAADRAALQRRLAPDLTPHWHGAHLNAAWYAARDAELFWPWFATDRAHALRRPPEIELAAIHDRAVDLLKAYPWHNALCDDVLSHDIDALVARIQCPITIAARAGTPGAARATLTLSDDVARRWAAIAALLGPQ
ncbi:MAG: alpha/beta fold hydrolase [Alphaproteobacteria bacterium]|nr:alpha/beta fold hydrolase [Alphaproteobacteria bacterium]